MIWKFSQFFIMNSWITRITKFYSHLLLTQFLFYSNLWNRLSHKSWKQKYLETVVRYSKHQLMDVVRKGSKLGGRAEAPLELVIYISLRDAIFNIQRGQRGWLNFPMLSIPALCNAASIFGLWCEVPKH